MDFSAFLQGIYGCKVVWEHFVKAVLKALVLKIKHHILLET